MASDMLRAGLSLCEGGLAAHWLHPKSKRPKGNDWASRPVASVDQLERTYRDGDNVGVRLGKPSHVHGLYCLVLDMDIRDEDLTGEAHAAMDELLPDWRTFPIVISGSGGKSRHVYLFSDKPFRSKKLRHSKTKFQGADKKWHWRWEIELFGTGKQVACPPSIHPDTGEPYRWKREIPWRDLKMGAGPIVESDTIEDWGGHEEDKHDDSVEDVSKLSLSDLAGQRPLGLTRKQVRTYLKDLDFDEYCFDYTGWLTVGMALHHEFEGDDAGLDEWHRYSEQSENYEPEALDEKWKSFGKDKRRKPVRFATIIKAGTINRMKREIAGADNDDDMHEDGDDPLAWLGRLDYGEGDAVKPTLYNLHLIVENDPRLKGLAALNEFTGEIVFRTAPGFKKAKSERRQEAFRQLEGDLWKLKKIERVNGRLWTDSHDNDIRVMLEASRRNGGYGFKITDRDLKAAIDAIATRNSFHPVRERLEGFEWDGEPRMRDLFSKYLGAEDTPYTQECARLFMTACVARAFEPGCKFDYAVIIEGPQGIRKSTFIKILALDWFTELDCGFEDEKKIVETLAGAWIYEIPELSQFSKSEVQTIKAFFSATEDKVRLSYARRAQVYLRQSVPVGSTNDEEYLRDTTGNRRFWPVKCDPDIIIDTDDLEANIEQLWAEAVNEYRVMREDHPHGPLPLYLRGKASVAAKGIQESRRIETEEDGLIGQILAWADEPVSRFEIENGAGAASKFENYDDTEDALVKREYICGLQIYLEVLNGSKEGYARSNMAKLSHVMRRLPGWRMCGRRSFPVIGQQRAYRRDPLKRKGK